MTKEEFCARFKAHMLKIAGEPNADNADLVKYAEQVAPTYYDDQHRDGESPEDCADGDMSSWEE